MMRSPIGKARLALPLSVAVLGVAMAAAPPAFAAAEPPPGRAYELVSPVDDLGAVAGLSTDLNPMPGIASEDGDSVLYGAGSILGQSWSGPANPMIFGRRTATGWEARSATRSLDRGETPIEASAAEAQSGLLTPDGQSFIFGSAGNFGAAPTAPGEVLQGVYRSPNSDAAPDWLSRPVGGVLPYVSTQPRGPLAISTSSNRAGDVTAFSSTAPLTPDAPPFDTSAVYAMYDGQLQLVSRLPDGSAATEASFMANGSDVNAGASNPPAVTHRNQLAGGGRFVLFRVGGTSQMGSLYVRDLANQVTHRLAGGAPGAPDQAQYLNVGWGEVGQVVAIDGLTVTRTALVFGARDSARAYFKGERVGSAAGAFVHEADLETGEVLAREAITGPPLGLSPDGRRMVFIAPTPTSSAAVAGAGGWTLRFWDAADPETSVAIGTITTAGGPPFGLARVYRSSADGRTWIFTAADSLDPDRPNVAPVTQQLYRWTVGEGAPRCLTCQPTDGVARTSGVNLTVQENIATESFVAPTTAGATGNADIGRHKRKLSQPGHSVSDDGRWVLFDSPDRLVVGDVNDVRDVYLWDRDGGPGGQLQLVTGGVGTTPSYALDLDPTGRNAFFSTREGLVAADDNGTYSVYTARIGGGFPSSPESSCGGDGCRPSAGPPGGPAIGSVAFAGRGNASTPARASVRVSGLRAVTGRVTRIRVRVPGAGRVSVAGRSVRRAGKSTRRAATYSVRVALKPGARRRLARRERLRVAVRVSYRSGSGQRVSKTVRITFKQPSKTGRKGGR
jgi:hypothetical protein